MAGKLRRETLKITKPQGGLFPDHPSIGISTKKPSEEAPALRVYQPDITIERDKLFKKYGIISFSNRNLATLAGDISGITNKLFCGDAASILSFLPNESVRCIITSPPYWNVVDYGMEGQYGQVSYEEYLIQLLSVWAQCARVLKPNGKLCINVPLMPIAKAVINEQHTRHLKNLCSDIEHSILSSLTNMYRFSLYVWQKQTTEKMFGSYPYPPNLYEQNTIEFISVLVKDGKPEIIPERVKEAAKITDVEWMNLTKQIWRLYPEDVKRARHPAPYPISLPSRLIAMYSFPRVPDEYEGDLILDPFNGTGSTCMAAKELGRNYVGLDLLPDFCVEAAKRIERTPYTGKIRLDEYGIQNKNGAKPKQQGQLKL